MKIEHPEVECFISNKRYIAYCARICYASNKNSNDDKFIETLWKSKHRSMFRHAPAYYIIPKKIAIPDKYWSYIHKVMHNGKWYVSTNEQCAKEALKNYEEYRISEDEAYNNEIFYNNKLIYFTIIIETGIDITREFNRKSPNAISEQSTRYVDFNKKLGIRFKHCHWMNKCNWYKRLLYNLMAKVGEWFYKISRSKYGLNLSPQDARWCLFLDTMSKVAYTYTVAEWEYIINMRLYDWTGKAHPDAKIVAEDIKLCLEQYSIKIDKYENDFEGIPI